MKNLTIRLIETPLTDGSLVYSVAIGSQALPCISRKDAMILWDGLTSLIQEHTNEEPEMLYHAHPGYDDARDMKAGGPFPIEVL